MTNEPALLTYEQVLLGVVTAWMAGLDPTDLPQFGHFMQRAKQVAGMENVDNDLMLNVSSWDASNEALHQLVVWLDEIITDNTQA